MVLLLPRLLQTAPNAANDLLYRLGVATGGYPLFSSLLWPDSRGLHTDQFVDRHWLHLPLHPHLAQGARLDLTLG